VSTARIAAINEQKRRLSEKANMSGARVMRRVASHRIAAMSRRKTNVMRIDAHEAGDIACVDRPVRCVTHDETQVLIPPVTGLDRAYSPTIERMPQSAYWLFR
jgi:hypothetical protein